MTDTTNDSQKMYPMAGMARTLFDAELERLKRLVFEFEYRAHYTHSSITDDKFVNVMNGAKDTLSDLCFRLINTMANDMWVENPPLCSDSPISTYTGN